ncbi:hypothetical protein KUV28_03725 [Ferrimonas balearica]|nr:hypothetical protein [Ferrimonas balearica]
MASGEIGANDAERCIERLNASDQFRVLRRLNVEGGVEELRPVADDERIAAIVDTETTGLDFETSELIEIAVQRVIFNAERKIVEVERPKSWLEEPSSEIPPAIVKITGIDRSQVSGRSFADDEITAALETADVIIAHNAQFDRPFVDRRFSQLDSKIWACSLTQIDWLNLGFDGRNLGYLLMQSGMFFGGHRAANDVAAVVALLRQDAGASGSILNVLLTRVLETSVRVEAVGAPFEKKDALKSHGFAWNTKERFWAMEVPETELNHLLEWLENMIYMGRGAPRVQKVSPRDRFRVS